MRRRAFLYALAASGRIGKARLAKGQTHAMTSPEFPFHVSVETRNDRLLIHYELENLSSRDVYFFTREVVRNEIVDAPGVEFDGDRENTTLWVYKVPNVIVGALLYQPIRVLFTPFAPVSASWTRWRCCCRPASFDMVRLRRKLAMTDQAFITDWVLGFATTDPTRWYGKRHKRSVTSRWFSRFFQTSFISMVAG